MRKSKVEHFVERSFGIEQKLYINAFIDTCNRVLISSTVFLCMER